MFHNKFSLQHASAEWLRSRHAWRNYLQPGLYVGASKGNSRCIWYFNCIFCSMISNKTCDDLCLCHTNYTSVAFLQNFAKKYLFISWVGFSNGSFFKKDKCLTSNCYEASITSSCNCFWIYFLSHFTVIYFFTTYVQIGSKWLLLFMRPSLQFPVSSSVVSKYTHILGTRKDVKSGEYFAISMASPNW